jgi:hypothetical protein
MEHERSKALEDAGRAYRRAFDDFSRRARLVQSLTAGPNPDRTAIDTALLELEKARVVYNRRRDALAQQLLRASNHNSFPPFGPDSPQAYAGRVRSIAELLWEVAGRPDGTAEDDWYRAEEILRRAAAA